MVKVDIPKELYEELQQKAMKVMAETNTYCGIDDYIRMLMKAWKMNPLVAAQLKQHHSSMRSQRTSFQMKR